jgi:hypothetical protein
MQFFWANAFDDLPAGEVIAAFTIPIDMGTGLLEASTMFKGVTLGKFGRTSPSRC